jgi:hypothetical protein
MLLQKRKNSPSAVSNNFDVYSLTGSKRLKLNYTVDLNHLVSNSIFTCDMNNVLRHGPKARVIAYSLYGQDPFYYNLLKSLVKQVYEKMPGWRMRVYYDRFVILL